MCHADLDVEHILIDPESGRLTGIIDWADVSLAPGCGEFTAFLGWRGEAFTGQELSHYDGDVGTADLPWLRQRAIHVALGNLAYGCLGDKPSYVRAGLHNLECLLSEAGNR